MFCKKNEKDVKYVVIALKMILAMKTCLVFSENGATVDLNFSDQHDDNLNEDVHSFIDKHLK
jgi:hypothetical protein